MQHQQAAQEKEASRQHCFWLAVVWLYVLPMAMPAAGCQHALSCAALVVLAWDLQVADWQRRQQARELCRGSYPAMRHTNMCHTYRQQLL
jgi:hypothetical protein